MASLHELKSDCNRLRDELADLRTLRENTTDDKERRRLILEIADLRMELCHSRSRLSAYLADTVQWFKRIYA